MDVKKLKNLIKREEGTKLDFKQYIDLYSEGGKKELAKDVCAIANSKGGRGYLIIGVEDKTKNIIGIDPKEIEEERVQQIVSSRCEPPIPISVEFINIYEKILAVINIYDSLQKPYQFRETGAFYIRRGSTTDTMRKQELISDFQNSMALSAELCSVIKSAENCLNKEIVDKYFFSQGIEVNDDNRLMLMENASIINKDRETNEYSCTLGGILVFSNRNNLFVPQNIIRIINKVNKNYDKITVVKGDLLSMIDESEKKLYEILPKQYPIDAICEGIKNAVVYRDYTICCKEIEIVINHSSIIISSPGILVKGKDINYHNYIKRNMWIYEKLMALDDKKRFSNTGKGFKKMKKAFKKYGKVIFVNSTSQNIFKVIYPGINKIIKKH
ncbi:helix-turn-helix domain-containing protein [Haloimpatiens sp. FM7330]|uniref:AlbA family DNA-binding domain-containing protein n=1 Tax=Haloimpatiens sp. FM7330 TaxID=3298610 RepID=UPI00363D706B